MREIRKDQITFTRFIAAIAIVIFHYGTGASFFQQSSTLFLLKQANIGVSYFFTLSGFIMVLAYAQSPKINIFKYYKSRFARIAPAYYFALFLLIPGIINNWWDYDHLGLVLNVLMLQAWIPSKALSVNAPGWSLSTELLFYCLFPFLFNLVYQVRKFRTVAALAVIFFLFSQLIHIGLTNSSVYEGYPSPSHNFLFYFPLMHLNEFIMGNIAGLFYVRYMLTVRRSNGIFIILTIVSLIVFLKFSIGLSLHNGLMAIIFIPLILLIVSDQGIFATAMSLKPFIFLGEISFGIYIYQLPIHNVCYTLFNVIGATDSNINFFTYLIILCFSSALSFKFLETPLRKRINHIRFTPKMTDLNHSVGATDESRR